MDASPSDSEDVGDQGVVAGRIPVAGRTGCKVPSPDPCTPSTEAAVGVTLQRRFVDVQRFTHPLEHYPRDQEASPISYVYITKRQARQLPYDYDGLKRCVRTGLDEIVALRASASGRRPSI